MNFAIKMIGSIPVLYVMAVDAEYGSHLRKRFQPLLTGVGPVEAAVTLTRTLGLLKASGQLPALVVCLGSAGSANLEQTEVYQATSISYRDMDASPLGFEKGATPFLDLPVTIGMPLRIPGVKQARLSTGGNIVSGAAYDTIDADMVDMETYAALRASMAFGIPLVGLRGISDGKAELKQVSDWTEYLHVIDARLSSVVDALEAGLRDGSIVV